MYTSVVGVHLHPSAVLAKQHCILSNPRPPPAFGAFSRPSGFTWSGRFRPNYPPPYLEGGRLLFSKGENCFGEVVDDAMLKEFGETTQEMQKNRARLALRLQNDDEKKGQACRYVANLKDKYGYGSSTLCLVYNATGHVLVRNGYHDWFNSSILYEHEYPEDICNGQWAAFLHVSRRKSETPSSVGAVVYSGKNGSGHDQDFLLAWDTPCSLKQHNKAYCEIGPVNSFNSRWDEIHVNKLKGSSYTARSSTDDGVEVDVQTERGTSPTFIAIIKLRA